MSLGGFRGCREDESCWGRATVRAPIAEDTVSGKVRVGSKLDNAVSWYIVWFLWLHSCLKKEEAGVPVGEPGQRTHVMSCIR